MVKKVDRQYAEINASSGNAADFKPLRVNEVAVEAFFAKFQWDAAQYQTQGKQLSELVSLIQSVAGKADDELKMLSTSFQEKTTALGSAKRRKVVNLVTSDFEDFLRPEVLAKAEFLDTEHLLTVTVVVPKASEQGMLANFYLVASVADLRTYTCLCCLFAGMCRVLANLRQNRRVHCWFWRTRLDQEQFCRPERRQLRPFY
ncbi:hypothetical protein EON65_06670 [archaeon]|nr:MAG: hypothetical protein EON65_06670 [archaeon]